MEYGLVLALASGVTFIQGLGHTVAEQPLLLVGGAAGVLVLGYLLLAPRRY